MTSIVVTNPQGIIPKTEPRLLPDQAAQKAENVALWSGVIRPLFAPLVVASPTKTGPIKSMYRMDDNAGGADFWLHWPTFVDVTRSPVSGDALSQQRVYYTGDSEPRVSRYEMAVLGTDTINGADNYPSGYGESGSNYPLAFYALGVHNPLVRPTVTASGGIAANATRLYTYTFVTAWGEESGPSPPTEITDKADATYTLTNLDTAPLNTGNIISATHASGVVTVETDGYHWLKPYHKITIASVGGMTDLNGTRTVSTVATFAGKTTTRERTSNVATVTLDTVTGLSTGMKVVIANMGGTGYNGTVTLTGVNTTNKTITYASVAADEASTADAAGQVRRGAFTVSLTTAQTYTSGGTWKREAPWNTANMTKRIYRTVTTFGETAYLFVTEIAAATTTYADSALDSVLTVPLVTEGFDVPKGNMAHITTMANGIMVGNSLNELCFSEPFLPYAWPPAYCLKTDYPICGLASLGTSVVIPTETNPYVCSGIHPSSMSMEKFEVPYPCQSDRGTISLGYGAVYPCDKGLVLIDANGPQLATRDFYDRIDWQTTVDADAIIAMSFDDRYYAFWTDVQGQGYGFIFSPAEQGANLVTLSTYATGTFTDKESGLAYIVDRNGKIAQWDADTTDKLEGTWRSKIFKLSKPVNFGAAIIDGDFTLTPEESQAIADDNAAIIAANAAIIASVQSGADKQDPLEGALGSVSILGESALGDDILQDTLGSAEMVGFSLFADSVEKYNTVVLDTKMFRLPSGFKSDTYEVRVNTNVQVNSIKVAETSRELETV